MRDGYFIEHCDNETCDLGHFGYMCPFCLEYQIDYNVWWMQDQLYENSRLEIVCEGCNEHIRVILKEGIKVIKSIKWEH